MIREQDSFYIIPSDAQDGDWVFVFRNPPIIVTDEVRTKGVASITMKLDDWVYDPNLFDFNVVEVDDVTSY